MIKIDLTDPDMAEQNQNQRSEVDQLRYDRQYLKNVIESALMCKTKEHTDAILKLGHTYMMKGDKS